MCSTTRRGYVKAAYEAAAEAYPIARQTFTVSYAAGWWTRSDGLKLREADLVALTEALENRAWAHRQGAPDTMIPPWSVHEDNFLISYGSYCQDGHAFVAQHDLGRTEQEGRNRIAWLRKHRPLLVKLIESEFEDEAA